MIWRVINQITFDKMAKVIFHLVRVFVPVSVTSITREDFDGC